MQRDEKTNELHASRSLQLNVSYFAKKNFKVLPKFVRYIDVIYVFWRASECAIMMTKENFNLE